MDNKNQNIGTSSPFSWAVAVFAARENPGELLSTINAIIEAAVEHTVIDVMVNGNQNLATEVAKLIEVKNSSDQSVVIRVWAILLGDKAHAWNQYVHHVWPGAKLSFFVDGYVRVQPNAFKLLETGLSSAPRSLGGTGVPMTGRTSSLLRKQMLTEGGIHGNFFALKEHVMKQLRQRKFNLPLGIYRTDATLGASLAFGLDPSQHQWDLKGRIFVHPEVTWTTNEKKWWRYSEVKSQFKRILRQAQGVLENHAIKNHLADQKLAPELLPRTAAELVVRWVKCYPDEARKALWKSPLSRLALKRFHEPRDWSDAELAPQLISTIR